MKKQSKPRPKRPGRLNFSELYAGHDGVAGYSQLGQIFRRGIALLGDAVGGAADHGVGVVVVEHEIERRLRACLRGEGPERAAYEGAVKRLSQVNFSGTYNIEALYAVIRQLRQYEILAARRQLAGCAESRDGNAVPPASEPGFLQLLHFPFRQLARGNIEGRVLVCGERRAFLDGINRPSRVCNHPEQRRGENQHCYFIITFL